jgi:Spy/CpxP family protein refolding chaperone
LLFIVHKEQHMSQLRSILWAGSALAVALACVASAEAQRQGQGRGGRGGFGGGGFGADPLTLLSNEKVQKELDLTSEQKDSVKKLADERQTQGREAFAALRDLSQDERRAKMDEMRKAAQAKVDAILLPPQVERLKQLTLQRQGAGALSDPEVAKALNISEDQKKQLADIREAAGAQMRELFTAGGGGGDRAAMREKMTAMQKEIMGKELAVLNADQKAQFEKMQGEKFEFPADLGRGGPGGRGGPAGAAGGAGGGRQRRGGNNKKQ